MVSEIWRQGVGRTTLRRKTLGDNLFQAVLLALGGCQQILDAPWLSDTSLQSLPLKSILLVRSHYPPCVYVHVRACVCVHGSSLLRRTPVILD